MGRLPCSLRLQRADVDDVAADPERFCEIDTELDELDPLNPNLAPDEIRLVILDSRTLLDDLRDVAPDEIRSSVNLAVDAAALMFDALEAAETIEVWIERNCESAP